MSQPPNDPSGTPTGHSDDQPTYGQPTYGSSYGQQPPPAPPSVPQYSDPQQQQEHYNQQYGQQPGWSQPSPAQYGTDIRQSEAGYAQMYGQKQRTGMSVAAMVLGILAFILAWFPLGSYIAVVLSILAVVFGIVGVRRGAGKGMAITGLVLGGIALVISVLLSIFYTTVGADILEITQQCIDETGTDRGPAFERCINDKGENYNPFD